MGWEGFEGKGRREGTGEGFEKIVKSFPSYNIPET